MDDDDKKYKINYLNNQKKKGEISKIWIQQQNTLPEGMLDKISFQKKLMKDSIDLLNEEQKIDKNKDKPYNLKRDLKRSSSSKIIEDVSPYAKTILLKVGKQIKRIKQSITDITKMNGLYLEERSKKSLDQINKKRSIPKIKLKKSSSDIISGSKNKTFNNFNKLDFLNNNEEKKNKKENYIKNFVYVNDNYRKQLNFAFLKYNPESHLENIKILVQAEPSIRKDIKKLREEIDEDIKWKCDKYHFKKKYLNYIAKYPRSRSVLMGEGDKKKQEKKNEKSVLPYINKKITKQNSMAFKQISFIDRLNKKEQQKMNALKEIHQEEINHMLSASEKIDNLLQNDNINNKIDLFKTDYAKKYYYYYTGKDDDSKNKENLLDKDYFVDDKKKVVEKIGDVYCFQINKNVDEKEKLYTGKIMNENEKFRKRIIDGKKNTMEEFNSFVINNQVKLPDEQQIQEKNDISD